MNPVARIEQMARSVLNRLTRPDRYISTRTRSRGRSLAGPVITPDTAMQVATVWAATRYLSQTVGNLTWRVKRYTTSGGTENSPRHPVDWLIWRRPNPDWSSFQFRETLTHWAIRHGNGYAEIERNDFGIPIALWPMHPDSVQAMRRQTPPYELYYEFSNGETRVELPARDVFHVRGYGDNEVGLSVIQLAAESIGWQKAVQLFGAAFFGNGMQPSGVVINKKGITPEGLEAQKAAWEEEHKGPRNKMKTFFLDNDAEYKAITSTARDAQLVEIDKHLVVEICRWIGVPPSKVMDLTQAHYNNIEHESISVVVDSVKPWVTRFEDEADAKLFGPANRNGFWTEMDLRDLLRGDMKATMEYRRGMVQVGALSPNEIREEDGLNSLGPEGDVHVMQQQMVPLKRIKAAEKAPEPQKQIAPPQPRLPAPEPEPVEDDPVDDSNADAILGDIDLILASGKAHVDA